MQATVYSFAFTNYYFLIPTSNENNLIYLFVTQTPEGEIKTQFLQWLSRSV